MARSISKSLLEEVISLSIDSNRFGDRAIMEFRD